MHGCMVAQLLAILLLCTGFSDTILYQGIYKPLRIESADIYWGGWGKKHNLSTCIGLLSALLIIVCFNWGYGDSKIS